MATPLKIVLGAVNYNDYLRISAAKVSDPGTEVFVGYIPGPISSLAYTTPALDPENYYISFRDAPDDSSLGSLVSQALVNALTGEWISERRYYTIGSLPDDVTMDGDAAIVDPYLVNKNVTGVFKEAFRFLIPGSEYEFNDSAGRVGLLGGQVFSNGETVAIEIKYNVAASPTASTIAAPFAATITVDTSTYSISASDKGKRFALDSLGSKQTVTLPLLSSIAEGDFVLLEHRRNGVQAQSRILTAGSDKILFNGFNLGSNELAEIWVSKGNSLKLRKESGYWEVIDSYDGQRVGERMAATFLSHPNWIAEQGQLMDGDEYPALYWWIRNVLPNTHYITDDNVVTGGYTHPDGKQGLFVIHSTLKKFRMPNTQGLSEKGLTSFDTYGADAGRMYDYPGGKQADQNKLHGHRIRNGKGGSSTNPLDNPVSGFSGQDQLDNWIGSNDAASTWVDASGGDEVRVKNIGVIYVRHI